MDAIELWARNGDAVREAIEFGDLVHLDTASEELVLITLSAKCPIWLASLLDEEHSLILTPHRDPLYNREKLLSTPI